MGLNSYEIVSILREKDCFTDEQIEIIVQLIIRNNKAIKEDLQRKQSIEM